MEIHFEIENRCMLNCRHCSSFAANDGKAMNYTIEEMIAFLQLFPEKKYVFLTGGEPLMHEQFDDIVYSLKNKVPDVSVGAFTTGIAASHGELYGMTEERARSLAALGLNRCYFSLYSAQEKNHDWMTKKEGSFALTLDAIHKLHAHQIEARINLVITKKNQAELDEMIELAASLGCTEVRLLKLINHGRAENCWSDIGVTETEYRESVLKHAGKHQNIKITASSCPDLLPCRPLEGAQGCQAGSKLAYVTYEGKVFPCACAKNNACHYIGKLEDVDALKSYFAGQKTVNDIALCKEERSRYHPI
jgi:MoaA/NifB/PqqE/SkfB family radical SAM enzyme